MEEEEEEEEENNNNNIVIICTIRKPFHITIYTCWSTNLVPEDFSATRVQTSIFYPGCLDT